MKTDVTRRDYPNALELHEIPRGRQTGRMITQVRVRKGKEFGDRSFTEHETSNMFDCIDQTLQKYRGVTLTIRQYREIEWED